MPESSDFKAFPHRGIEFPPVLRDFFDVSGVVALLFGQFGTNTPHRFKPTIRGAARKKRMNRRRLSAFCKKEKAMNKLELVEQVASETETSKAAAASGAAGAASVQQVVATEATLDDVNDPLSTATGEIDGLGEVGMGEPAPLLHHRAVGPGHHPAALRGGRCAGPTPLGPFERRTDDPILHQDHDPHAGVPGARSDEFPGRRRGNGVRVAQTIMRFGEMVGRRNHTSRSPRRRGRLLRVGDLPGFTGERRRLEFTAARRRSKVS